MTYMPPKVIDSSALTDADWAEINKLRKAQREGRRSLVRALDELAKDLVRYCRVMEALFPGMMRNVLKDAMAERGLTAQDLCEMARKLESPARDQ
jgi:hypothetical protein